MKAPYRGDNEGGALANAPPIGKDERDDRLSVSSTVCELRDYCDEEVPLR
jgi:hypothetical protein